MSYALLIAASTTEKTYATARMWLRNFPILVGVICVILLIVVLKKMFGGEGASGGNGKFAVILFGVIFLCAAAIMWFSKNYSAPDLSGNTWK